jgi:ATP-dependent DNA ligase
MQTQSVETRRTGEALFALGVGTDFEGIVAKQLDAPYLAGP